MAGVILGGIAAATGLASLGIGIGNAGKARRAALKAERESKQLMKEAERKAEVNYYEGLNVPLDAFNKQFEEQLQQQQQSLQALQEGDPRNLAAGVGRVGALAANQGEKTRIAMGEALYENNKMKADAKDLVNQQLIDINVGAAADQSMMARDARRAESQGMQQAVEGLGAVAGAASDLVKPFSMSKADRRASKLLGSISAADKSKLNLQGLDDTAIIARLSQIPNIENMTRAELNVIMEQIKNEQFDFDFDLNNMFKPVSSVSPVTSSGVAPTSTGTGISAPVYTGQ